MIPEQMHVFAKKALCFKKSTAQIYVLINAETTSLPHQTNSVTTETSEMETDVTLIANFNPTLSAVWVSPVNVYCN